MRLLTITPLGRMANACRDNFERAQFMGYDPRTVRFLQFSLAGFFAGIGGGLYAITYEIVTFDAVASPLSANALLMAYIGGAMVFAGPVLGAVLITLLQSGVSLMSNSWLIYVGVLFIAMVTFAPTAGVAGGPAVAPAGAISTPVAGSNRIAGRLRRPGGAIVVPHHRCGARQAPCAVWLAGQRSQRVAMGDCWRAAAGWWHLVGERSTQLLARVGSGD
jgi:branched-chain amino acid transport system permease protein